MGVKNQKIYCWAKLDEEWIWAELGSWVYMFKTLYEIIKELIKYILLIGASLNSALQQLYGLAVAWGQEFKPWDLCGRREKQFS